jgi:hypothetical protein
VVVIGNGRGEGWGGVGGDSREGNVEVCMGRRAGLTFS